MTSASMEVGHLAQGWLLVRSGKFGLFRIRDPVAQRMYMGPEIRQIFSWAGSRLPVTERGCVMVGWLLRTAHPCLLNGVSHSRSGPVLAASRRGAVTADNGVRNGQGRKRSRQQCPPWSVKGQHAGGLRGGTSARCSRAILGTFACCDPRNPQSPQLVVCMRSSDNLALKGGKCNGTAKA